MIASEVVRGIKKRVVFFFKKSLILLFLDVSPMATFLHATKTFYTKLQCLIHPCPEPFEEFVKMLGD